LVIQDILKTLIKNNYDTFYIQDIYNEKENNKEKQIEQLEQVVEQITSKLFYYLI
jgi:hypothetical protein